VQDDQTPGEVHGVGIDSLHDALNVLFQNPVLDITDVEAITDDPSLSKQRVSTPHTRAIQGLAVTATSRDDVEAEAVRFAAAAVGAPELSGLANVITFDTEAFISAGAKINSNNTGASTSQAVLVAAGSDSSHFGNAGAVTGASLAAFGAGADVTLIQGQTR